jgi:hypothetical protein
MNTTLVERAVILVCVTVVAVATVPLARTITLDPADNLRQHLYDAAAGTTILLADGTYAIEGILQIRSAGVTLRSASGERDRVILDGNRGGTPLVRTSFTPEIIQISASDVTVADLTVRHAAAHAIHAFGAADHTIRNVTLRNLHIYDCGEQLVKVNSGGDAATLHWVDSGLVEGCLIEFVDNSVMRDMGSYYYTGGIDVHGGRDWIIRDNTFRNIWRENKMMEHAVHFWSRSRGTLVENNHFINCWRAVGLGMKTAASGHTRTYEDHAGESPYFDHMGGMIRNNVVYNDGDHRLETGIELMNVTGTEVYHNTVVSVVQPFNSMEYRWENTAVVIKNNLCSHAIMQRNGAGAETAANITDAALSLFVDPGHYDLHLRDDASAAIDGGVVLPEGKAGKDMDGVAIGEEPDIGADQLSPATGSRIGPTRGRPGAANTRPARFFTLTGRRLARPRPFRPLPCRDGGCSIRIAHP